jgi:prepilin peptidase CpaA
MPLAAPLVLLGLLLAVAVGVDLRTRKIPNLLLLVVAICATTWHSLGNPGAWAFDKLAPGAVGFGWSLLSAVVLMVAFLPFYALRAMGAGDVKLIAVVASIFGMSATSWSHLLGLGLAILLSGGVLAIARMLWSGTTVAVARNVALILRGSTAHMGGSMSPDVDPRHRSADPMPYSLAIAGGAVAVVLTQAI